MSHELAQPRSNALTRLVAFSASLVLLVSMLPGLASATPATGFTVTVECDHVTFTGPSGYVVVSGYAAPDGFDYAFFPSATFPADGIYGLPLAVGHYTYEIRPGDDNNIGGEFDIVGCAGTVTFLKHVDGGTATPGQFTMYLSGNTNYSGVDGQTIEVVPGTYTLTEDQQPGYISQYGGGCYNNEDPNVPNTAEVVTVAAGESWTCGFTNTFVPATVTFLKNVDGGYADRGDFTITLTGDQTYSGTDGQTVEVEPGTYTVTEDQKPGYTSEFGGGCYNNDTQDNTGDVVTIGYSEHWTCGFDNTFVPATVTFLKNVDGGDAERGDFLITLTGDQTYSGYDGETVEVEPGTYVLTEEQRSGYTSIFGGGCYTDKTNSAEIVTIGYSEHWTCGFTNTFVEATPTATPTASPTATPTASPTATPTATPTASPTASPTATPTATATHGTTPPTTALPRSNQSGNSLLLILLSSLLILTGLRMQHSGQGRARR